MEAQPGFNLISLSDLLEKDVSATSRVLYRYFVGHEDVHPKKRKRDRERERERPAGADGSGPGRCLALSPGWSLLPRGQSLPERCHPGPDGREG